MKHLSLLNTDCFSLRLAKSADREHLFRLYSDPQVMQFARNPLFTDIADRDAAIQSMHKLLATQEALE